MTLWTSATRHFRLTPAGLLAAVSLGIAAPSTANESMRAWIDGEMADGGNLAISVVTIRNGEPRFASAGSIEPGGAAVDENSQFQIGSISKVFTNLLLAEMVADGAVDYETRVTDILGDKVEFQNASVGAITLEALATHRSGLPRLPTNFAPGNPQDPYADYDEQALLAGIATARDEQPLGSYYGYSNYGAGLLGYLLGRVTGDGYVDSVADRIVEPLGLEHTGMQLTDNRARGFRGGNVVTDWQFSDALAGAGALWGSAADFVRFHDYLVGDSNVELKLDRDDILKIVAETPDSYGLTCVWHVAYDGEQPVYWHNGGTGGFWSFFGFRPDTGDAVAILVSGNTNPTSRGLEWLNASARPATSQYVDESVIGSYALTPQINIDVFERRGRLFTQLSGQSPLPLEAVGYDWWAIHLADASLHFLRDREGVIAVELAQNGILQRAEKTGDQPRREQRSEVDLTEEQHAEFAGTYRINPQAVFTIRPRDGGLEAQITGQPFLPIFAAGDDVYFYKAVDAELRFERDGAEVIALVLHQGAIVQRAERVSE